MLVYQKSYVKASVGTRVFNEALKLELSSVAALQIRDGFGDVLSVCDGYMVHLNT